MSEDIVKESIKCLANMEIKETTYQVARSVVLDEIERLNNIINELEKDMIFDMNDYGKDLDIQTGNIYLEYHRGYCQNGKDYYDKLQELKGSDKE